MKSLERTIRKPGPLVLAFLMAALFPCRSKAQEPHADATSARPCIGYNHENGKWGIEGTMTEDRGAILCPSGSAFLGATSSSNRSTPGDEVMVLGFCCPLPDGSLTAEHEYVPEACPENTVATGAIEATVPPKRLSKNGNPVRELRCTHIDVSRFTLGPARNGTMVAASRAYFRDFFRTLFPSIFGKVVPRQSWGSLPPRIRYGLGRSTLHEWYPEICVGTPAGSVLVAKTGGYCGTYEFRELLRKPSGGAADAEPDREACDAVDTFYSPGARCLVSRKAAAG